MLGLKKAQAMLASIVLLLMLLSRISRDNHITEYNQ